MGMQNKSLHENNMDFSRVSFEIEGETLYQSQDMMPEQ